METFSPVRPSVRMGKDAAAAFANFPASEPTTVAPVAVFKNILREERTASSLSWLHDAAPVSIGFVKETLV